MSSPLEPSEADGVMPMTDHGSSGQQQRGRRPSLLDGAVAGARSPEDILRRLSLGNPISQEHNNTTAEDAQAAKARLGLSGNVISAAFCVPYKIGHRDNGEWDISSRRGTSALFDSFSYLASSESEWRHTLVGWTGEIERIQDLRASMGGARAAAVPANRMPGLPFTARNRLAQSNAAAELHIPAKDRAKLESLIEQHQAGRVSPVWLPDEVHEDESFTLRDQHKWRRYGEHELFTLFHYKQNEPNDGRATKKAWNDYVRMNEAFADRIMEVYSPGDLVLIHDYHLFLLPSLLRQRIPNAYIGFFLHILFPSYEYFRCLTKRKDILQGVLGANMIGFQTHSYSRHFSESCRQLLGYNSDHANIPAGGGDVAIEVCPIGINATQTWQAAFGSDEVETMITQLNEDFPGCKIIVGRDRLDPVRGVAQKLEAYEVFLERHPEWQGKVILVQVTSPTSIEDRDGKNEKTEGKITELVTRINSNFGTMRYSPVIYKTQYLSKDDYLALLRTADLGLITSVRDGMNTTALEYIVCQHKKHAPLIISEFSGTAGSLNDAIHINPWDTKRVAEAIFHALTMDEEAKARSHTKLYAHVMENNIQKWTQIFVHRLVTNLEMSDRTVNTPPLDREFMVDAYRQARRRLFMFDYDGTLTPIVRDPSTALPSDKVLRTLKTLASDNRNSVWIVSGRTQDFLEEWMGDITELGLSAEHGCFIRQPNDSQWRNLTEEMDLSWHEKVIKIFGKYTAGGTNGTHIERKRVALTWHYRRADPRWSAGAARECLKELMENVEPFYAVDVMKGKMNLEVRPRFVNKGEIARRLIRNYGEHKKPEFVLCAGDDHTDEDMFRSLKSAKLPEGHVFAVTVGPSSKQTLASYHVLEPADVISSIEALNKAAMPGKTSTTPTPAIVDGIAVTAGRPGISAVTTTAIPSASTTQP